MAVVKKPCFDYQAKTKGKEKGYGLTPTEIKPLWLYARRRYLDSGMPFEDAINRLVAENPGSTPRFWEEVFTGGKTPAKLKTKEMFALEDARRSAIYKAEKLIENADKTGFAKAMRALGEIPRASLTAFHGGVFPVTHGGGLLLRPTAWGDFMKGASLSWRMAGVPYLKGPLGMEAAQARYTFERLKLQGEANYAPWRQAGLRIGVDERAQGVLTGWLSNTPGWSNRAWLGLMRMRYELAEHMMRTLPKSLMKNPEERMDIMKKIAEIANHSTGVSNIDVFGKMSRSMFAPQLTTSKLLRVTHDPAQSVLTAARMMIGKPTTAAERAALYFRTRNATEMMGFWMGGLMLNDAMLKQFGSDQRINFGLTHSDWSKGDVLRFKLGDGTVLASRGPEEFVRLFGQLIALSYANQRELHGKDPQAAMTDVLSHFAQYKISPGYGTTIELGYGADMFGRPLPPVVQKARGLIGMTEQTPRPGKEQYTNMEYLWTHAPIFLDGPARDIYDDMRERGLSEPDAKALVHASFLTALEFAGFGGYREKETSGMTFKKGGKPHAAMQ